MQKKWRWWEWNTSIIFKPNYTHVWVLNVDGETWASNHTWAGQKFLDFWTTWDMQKPKTRRAPPPPLPHPPFLLVSYAWFLAWYISSGRATHAHAMLPMHVPCYTMPLTCIIHAIIRVRALGSNCKSSYSVSNGVAQILESPSGPSRLKPIQQLNMLISLGTKK